MCYRFSRSLSFVLALLFAVSGCDTSQPGGGEPQTVGIAVASQGAFGQDTGGVIRFNLDGTPGAQYPGGGAGLYVQSADAAGDRLFATTTGTVDVLDARTLARTARLDVPNPRYLAFDGDVAFVTSLYTNPATFGAGAVTRLSVPRGGTASVGTRAVIGGNPEGVALAGGRLYVANHDFGAGTTVTVLNPSTLAEIARIEVCAGPRFLFTDAQAEVVVVCEGGGFGEGATNGAFVVLSGATGAIVTRVDLPTPLRTTGGGQTAAYAPETGEVFALHNGSRTLYRFDTRTNTVSGTANLGGAPVNAIAYDAARSYVLVGRFPAEGNPYTSQGSLTVHARDGQLVQTVANAGIAPTHIAVLTGTP